MRKIKPKICLCGCGETFTPKSIGQKWVDKTHKITWLTETEAGKAEVKKVAEKAKKQREKKEKQEWKEKVDLWKPKTHEKKYKAQLQIEINKLSRMIDAKFGYETCIDCNRCFGKQRDAAHFTGIGSNNSIRYNLHNLHTSRSDCNQFSDKHKQGYEIGLKERYGIEYYEKVASLPLTYPHIKLSAYEVVDKLKVVRGLIKHFDTYQAENSIAMRENFNKIIGIY